MNFLKRFGNFVFAAISAILLISLFMPWFDLNVLITSKVYHGYNLGFLSVVLILLGLLGMVSASIQMKRFQGLLEGIIGALSLIMIWIGQAVFFSKLTSVLNGMAGGTDYSGSQQASSVLGTTDFGFYIGLIAAFALIILGGYTLYIYKNEPIAPNNLRAVFSRERLASMRSSVAQAAATVESAAIRAGQQTAQSNIWNRLHWRSKSGKALWIVVGLVVLYGVVVSISNSTNSATGTVRRFVKAVNAGNVSQVVSMLDETNTLVPGVARGFVDYYQTNPQQLQYFLSPLLNTQGSSGSNLSSIFGSNAASSPSLVSYNVMGFVHYKIQLPEVPMQLSGPNGVKYVMEGKTIPSNSYVLPAVYSVSAVIKSPLGLVTDKQTEDATQTSSLQDQFQFSSDMITVSLQSIPYYSGKGTLFLNGKPVQAQFTNGNATIGPLPVANNTFAISAELPEPWGQFMLSGQDQYGQILLNSDPSANVKLAKTLANIINEFNKQDTADSHKGNYNPELKFLAPNSPAFQNVQNKSGTGNSQYLGMIVSPDLELTPIGNSNQYGVNVNDTERYNNMTDMFGFITNGSVDWTYTMEYYPAKKKWLIYDEQQNYNDLSPGSGNLSLK